MNTLLLFLLLLSGQCVFGVRWKKVLESDESQVSMSRENSNSIAYSDEHDRNEISREEHQDETLDFEGYVVCRKDGADHCHCEKDKVDCRGETRNEKSDGDQVPPFQSAGITVNLEEIKSPKYVYLTRNQITVLNRETLLPKIQPLVEGLDVGFNYIEVIAPNAFSKFTSLRKLRLNHNYIKINKTTDGWLTEKLGDKLEVLNLGYNTIKTINDGAFDCLHKLNRLLLDGNPGLILTDTTFGKDGLVSLTTLSLDSCNLDNKKLSANAFKNLPNLLHLSLINNNFKVIPAALKSISNLNTLDFSKNPLTEWKDHALSDQSKLTKLYLTNMKSIKSYDSCAFCGLTDLTFIDLSDSKQLETIDENAFGFRKNPSEATEKLKVIRFEGCNIKSFSQYMLNWQNQEEIGISDNPLDCGEELNWLITARDLHLFVGKKVPRCQTPKELEGVPLQKIVDETQSSSGGFFRSVFYGFLMIGLIAGIVFGFTYVNRRYNVTGVIGQFFHRQRSTGVGFNNLNSEVGVEINDMFDEEDEGFHPRPAAV